MFCFVACALAFQKTRVQIWLAEQNTMRLEGQVLVSISLLTYADSVYLGMHLIPMLFFCVFVCVSVYVSLSLCLCMGMCLCLSVCSCYHLWCCSVICVCEFTYMFYLFQFSMFSIM